MRALLLICLPLLAAAQEPCAQQPVRRPCWLRMISMDENRTCEGHLPPGGEEPRCDAEGRFLPKQCSGSQCYCVEPNGDQLKYTQNRWEADEMMCKCAAEEAKIAKEGLLGPSVDCDKLGNYHYVQCMGSECHCAHPHTGEKRTEDVAPISEYESLEARCSALN